MFRQGPSLLLVLSLISIQSSPLLLADEHKEKKPVLTPEAALARLQEGNRRFVKDRMEARSTYIDQRTKLARGQQPFAIVLSCADSRVVPEWIFDQQLGAMFVLRVAG